MANEPTEEFSPEIRAAFDNYPCPVGDAAFDAKFWRELDARQNRYRGLGGLLRRLIEVEIEGIAVWRLGVALFSVPVICAIGVALLNLSSAPVMPTASAPQIAQMPLDPLSSPRFAREFWDAPDYEYRAPKAQSEKPKGKEEISCVLSDHDLA